MGRVLKCWHRFLSPVVIVGVLAFFVLSAGGEGVALAAPASGCRAWSVVTSPNVAGEQNYLQSVATIAANDVWSVGDTYNTSGDAFTLTQHWNGKQWSIVSSPNTSGMDNLLNGVASVATSDVWVVGAAGNAGQGPLQTLIEHWNGTKWSIVSSPNSQLPINQLHSVAAISSTNVWAVGNANSLGGPTQTLIEHWDGKLWKIVSSPNTKQVANYLYGVTAIATNDIWAVGSAANNDGSAVQTLIEHWNGTKWSIVSSPNVMALNILNSVSAAAANDVWTVGYTMDVSGTTIQTLIEHWNGGKWKVVPGPNPSGENNTLNGVVALSNSKVWAVGNAFNTGNAKSQALIEKWNGTTWKIVASPNPSTDFSVLNGVAALSAQAVWSVGDYLNSSGSYQTLTEYYC